MRHSPRPRKPRRIRPTFLPILTVNWIDPRLNSQLVQIRIAPLVSTTHCYAAYGLTRAGFVAHYDVSGLAHRVGAHDQEEHCPQPKSQAWQANLSSPCLPIESRYIEKS